MMAEIKGETEVAEICYAFGKFMRYSLSSHNMETSLGEELENIEHFIKIHKLRLGDRFAVDVEKDSGIESFRCPRFILQPIVENAVVHGISKIRGQGLLTIRIRDRGELVEVAVSDNGRGVPEARLATIHAMLQNKTDIRDFQSEPSGVFSNFHTPLPADSSASTDLSGRASIRSMLWVAMTPDCKIYRFICSMDGFPSFI